MKVNMELKHALRQTVYAEGGEKGKHARQAYYILQGFYNFRTKILRKQREQVFDIEN